MRSKGFSMLDMLLAMAVMAILIAILFPVMARSKERGKTAKCIMNCKAIVQSLQSYANDWGNKLPHPGGFTQYGNFPNYSDAIQPYVKNRNIFYCPSQYRVYGQGGYPGPWQKFVPKWDPLQNKMVSYGMNLLKYDQVMNPQVITLSLGSIPFATRTILIAETNDGSPIASSIDRERHNGMSNYVFFDGHVKTMDYKATLRPNMWTITLEPYH